MNFHFKKNKTHNIKYILFTSQILIIVFSLTAFLIISSIHLLTKAKSDAIKDMSYSVKISAINISNYTEQLADILFSTSYKTNIADILSSSNTLDVYGKFKNYQDVINILSIADENCSFPFDICLYTNKADRIYYDSVNVLNETAAQSQPWYETLLQRKNKFCYITETIDNAKYISIINIINDVNNHNNIVGFIKISINASVIKGWLKSTAISDRYITVVKNNDNGVFCTSMDEDFLDDWKETTFSETTGVCINTKFQGKQYLALSENLANTNWDCIILFPYSDLFFSISTMIVYLFIILMVVFAIAYLISSKIAKSIANPLDALLSRMKNIKLGELAKFEYLNTNNAELQEVISAYNTMISDIQEIIDYSSSCGDLVKKYELDLLQSQIKPHFLYNTLNLINWLAKTNDINGVTELVDNLSKFYRASLGNNKNIAKVCDELNHIYYYVKIENSKYKNKIKLIVDVPEEIMQIEMPKITLQPLVENAIIHGILEKDDQTGTISISARINGNDIDFSVCDDGVGIPPEKLNSILNVNENSSIGITNTDKRLKLYYGEKYGLILKSDGKTFTCVEFKIKMR